MYQNLIILVISINNLIFILSNIVLNILLTNIGFALYIFLTTHSQMWKSPLIKYITNLFLGRLNRLPLLLAIKRECTFCSGLLKKVSIIFIDSFLVCFFFLFEAFSVYQVYFVQKCIQFSILFIFFFFQFLIRYFLHLHFKCYPEGPLYSPPPCSPTHSLPLLVPGIPLYWGIYSL